MSPHGDADHANEVDNILNDIDIKCLNINSGDINYLAENALKRIKTCSYKSKNMVLDYLNYKIYDNENDNSIVLYIELNNRRFLFMGDAGIEVENDLIDTYNLQNIDVLKVGHHGSKTSSSENFINVVKPKYSVISVGKNNKYGHSNKEVLDNLKDSKTYRTEQDGSIMFTIKIMN